MGLFARKRLPAPLAAANGRFAAVLRHVERAKEEVMAAVPVARVLPRTLAEALLGFDTELLEAQERMGAWRVDELAREWDSCADGISESLRLSEALRIEAPEMGFESLVGMIGDLIVPLEAFERAAERFEELKR